MKIGSQSHRSFNDRDWTTKEQYRKLCAQRDKNQTRSLVLAGVLRQRRRGGTNIPTNPDTQMVDIFTCHTSHPPFPAPLSLGPLKKGGRTYHFQGTLENKKILIKTMLARQPTVYPQLHLPVVCYRKSWEEEEVDFDAEQLTTITQKERSMSQARGDSTLKLHEKRETLLHTASETAEFARTGETGQLNTTNESGMDEHSSSPPCREYSDPWNSRNS